ncbi:hypothetical protein [Paenibacillus sp. 1011MAR3C5]|uniref:hypothetical protein n=1 Tax=Paenibacillus sp. 1011MAR3C5 TaxID=1675787 RepID=UPI00160290AF|nr:hypothetical protein [Paenibacillus sp. 1011MAR3C5]
MRVIAATAAARGIILPIAVAAGFLLILLPLTGLESGCKGEHFVSAERFPRSARWRTFFKPLKTKPKDFVLRTIAAIAAARGIILPIAVAAGFLLILLPLTGLESGCKGEHFVSTERFPRSARWRTFFKPLKTKPKDFVLRTIAAIAAARGIILPIAVAAGFLLILLPMTGLESGCKGEHFVSTERFPRSARAGPIPWLRRRLSRR